MCRFVYVNILNDNIYSCIRSKYLLIILIQICGHLTIYIYILSNIVFYKEGNI